MTTTQTTDNPTEQTTASTTAANTANNVELSVADLQALRQIIDVASSRGAFKTSEMTAVGTVYTKLDTFLNAVAAQQPGDKNA